MNDEESDLSEYSDDEFKNIKYQKRNEEIYKLLKNIKIWVIPDPRIKPLDNLPHFNFIYDDLTRKVSIIGIHCLLMYRRKLLLKIKENKLRRSDSSRSKLLEIPAIVNRLLRNKKIKKSPSLECSHKLTKIYNIKSFENVANDSLLDANAKVPFDLTYKFKYL